MVFPQNYIFNLIFTMQTYKECILETIVQMNMPGEQSGDSIDRHKKI